MYVIYFDFFLKGVHMDVLSGVNWVDVLVVIIMLRTVYVSFQSGLSHEIFPLFGSVLSLLLALFFYSKIGSAFHDTASIIPISICNLTGFVAVIVAMSFILKILKGLIDAVIKVTWHPLIERSGGLLLGMFRGAVILSTILIVIALVPLSYLQESIKEKSVSGMFFLEIGPAMYRVISGGSIDDSRITNDIVATKNLPQPGNKVAKDKPEWEKVLNAADKKTGGTR